MRKKQIDSLVAGRHDDFKKDFNDLSESKKSILGLVEKARDVVAMDLSWLDKKDYDSIEIEGHTIHVHKLRTNDAWLFMVYEKYCYPHNCKTPNCQCPIEFRTLTK